MTAPDDLVKLARELWTIAGEYRREEAIERIASRIASQKDAQPTVKDSLTAHPAPVQQALTERLRHAGAMLSNCAFNLAQRNPGEFTTRDIEALDECRKEWDAAYADILIARAKSHSDAIKETP